MDGWTDGWMLAVLPDKLNIEHEKKRKKERTNVWYACAWFASYVKSLRLCRCRFVSFSLLSFFFIWNFFDVVCCYSLSLSVSPILSSYLVSLYCATTTAAAVAIAAALFLSFNLPIICDEVVCWECTREESVRNSEQEQFFFVSATQCVCNLSESNKNN